MSRSSDHDDGAKTPRISGSYSNFALSAKVLGVELREQFAPGESAVADMLVEEANKLADRFEAWPKVHPSIVAFERLFLPEALRGLLIAIKAFRESNQK